MPRVLRVKSTWRVHALGCAPSMSVDRHQTAQYTVLYSLTHSPTHSLTHSLTHITHLISVGPYNRLTD
jgi:hypothetical protein